MLRQLSVPRGVIILLWKLISKNTVVRKIMLCNFKFAIISTNNLLSGAMKSSWYSLNGMVSGSFGKSSLYENAIGSSTCLSVSHPYSTSFAWASTSFDNLKSFAIMLSLQISFT